MTAVGFEPTQLALVELESTPLDHSGKLSCRKWRLIPYSTDNSSDQHICRYLLESVKRPDFQTSNNANSQNKQMGAHIRSPMRNLYCFIANSL